MASTPSPPTLPKLYVYKLQKAMLSPLCAIEIFSLRMKITIKWHLKEICLVFFLYISFPSGLTKTVPIQIGESDVVLSVCHRDLFHSDGDNSRKWYLKDICLFVFKPFFPLPLLPHQNCSYTNLRRQCGCALTVVWDWTRLI